MDLKLKAGQFYGTTSQSLTANGFRFTEKAYESCALLPTHAHELSHFCFVLAGNYRERIAGRFFERAPASAWLKQTIGGDRPGRGLCRPDAFHAFVQTCYRNDAYGISSLISSALISFQPASFSQDKVFTTR